MLTYFYYEAGQWRIDIPGHLVVHCNSYVHALNKWKIMRQNLDESGRYRVPPVATQSPMFIGDLTKTQT